MGVRYESERVYGIRRSTQGDLLAHVRANQAHYLGCVFAIIRAWCAAGKPKSDETRHDFREWVQILDWIVHNYLKMPPIMDGHQQAQERVSNPDRVFLRALAMSVARLAFYDKPLTANDIQTICESDDVAIPGLRGGIVDAERAARQIGCCMRRLFRDGEVIELEDCRVVRRITTKERTTGYGNYDVKTYVFTRAGDTLQPSAVMGFAKSEFLNAQDTEPPWPDSISLPGGGIRVSYAPTKSKFERQDSEVPKEKPDSTLSA
jgi:hypothetical protein